MLCIRLVGVMRSAREAAPLLIPAVYLLCLKLAQTVHPDGLVVNLERY